jgi:hypothetical protein
MAIGAIKDISVFRPGIVKREKEAGEHKRDRGNKRFPKEPEEKADHKEGKVNIRV